MSPKRVDAQGTQPSISAFFKRKEPPSPVKGKARDPPSPIAIDDDDDDEAYEDLQTSKRARTFDVQDDEDSGSRPVATSSSYFGESNGINGAKRTSSTSTNAVSGPSGSRKGPNVRLQGYALPSFTQPSPTASGSAFQNYTVETSGRLSSPVKRTAEQERVHEAWQEKLGAPGGAFPRRRSLALDEAAAREARVALGESDPGESRAVSETPIVQDSDEEESESRKTAEVVGDKLMAKFAAANPKANGKKPRGKKKADEVGPSGQTYTPLEKQFMEIKKENPDVLLMMEVGYKYKFHGYDAKIAGRELGIAAFPSRNFYTASIPTHRLHVHVKKLISLGYKVGVISQMETAALKKVGDNRNAPFTRELTHLFTAATYVEDASLASSSNLLDEPIVPGTAPSPTNALVSLVEKGLGGTVTDELVRIAIVSVVPGTGEVVWDEFEDSQVRTELETRLSHLQPAELLLPASGLSRPTEKVLAHFSGHSRTSTFSIRVERFDEIPSYTKAFDYLTKFYGKSSLESNDESVDSDQVDLTKDSEPSMNGDTHSQPGNGLQEEGEEELDAMTDPVDLAAGLPAEEAVLALVDFPKQIVIALCIAVKYMKTFKLENAFRHRSSFTKFINRAHMLLSSNTLVNLEIYRNQTDGSVYGSLLWLLDHTKTKMGRRLMREWLGRPLLDVVALQARIDAIEDIMDNKTYYMEKLRSLLVNMPDLVKGLTRIQYGKATPTELATILVNLHRVGAEFKAGEHNVFHSALLNSILRALPTIREPAKAFLDEINVKEARLNDEANLWNDADKYPEIQDAKDCIAVCDSDLNEHLHVIRKTLHRPSLQYVTVAGIEYLVEVPVRDSKSVPAKWVKVQATKSVNRYHTPDILRITKEREQHKETLTAVAHKAFLSFQNDTSECQSLVVVARQIAVIDCLMSLGQVASVSGYCKPTFVAEPCLHIRDGRHPMVEMLRDEAYVPFDIDFSEDDGRAKVITGPNMAGKSSCVRATALIVCMAQIGSFVPASSVTLGIHDTVQTRMGASDEIGRGKSTFMVELSETSDILRCVTPRSLVILDELGRGTSTFDGVAIAYATLSHIAEIGCNTLFVTHYPVVAEELASEYPKQVSNWHMSFEEIKMPDGSAEITFLYRLTKGLAEASFGVWCARLAGLPKSVLENAQLRADQMRYETAKRAIQALTSRSRRLLGSLDTTKRPVNGDSDMNSILDNLSVLHKALRLAVNP